MKEKIIEFRSLGAMIKAHRLGMVPRGYTTRVVFDRDKPLTKRKKK